MRYIKKFNDNYEAQSDDYVTQSDDYETFIENVESLLVEIVDDGTNYKYEFIDGFYDAIVFRFDDKVSKDKISLILESVEHLIKIKFNDMSMIIRSDELNTSRSIMEDIKKSNTKFLNNLEIIFVV